MQVLKYVHFRILLCPFSGARDRKLMRPVMLPSALYHTHSQFKGHNDITQTYLVRLHHQHLLQFERLLCCGPQPVLMHILHSPQLAFPETFLLLVNPDDNLFVMLHGLTQVGQFGVAFSQSNLQFHDSRV